MFDQQHETPPPTPPTETHDEPAATPPVMQSMPVKKKRNPFLFILILLVVAALAAVATYTVMTFVIGSSKKTDTATVTQSTTVTPSNPQADKILAVIEHAKTLLPSTKAISTTDAMHLPHRKVGTPYNLYAIGTGNDAWQIRSDTIANTTSAASVTKSIYEYFVTDQKATIDTLIGDTTFTPVEKTDTKFVSYRVNTADYTCGLTEEPAAMGTTGAIITLSCSTDEEYTKNAKIQQPFYTAMSTDKTYTADVTMLGTPKIKDSVTKNYKTAEVSIWSDSELAGGAMGLFYQTPDAVWHFFTGTQQELQCSLYNTPDLKKAYAGEACFDGATNSKVAAN